MAKAIWDITHGNVRFAVSRSDNASGLCVRVKTLEADISAQLSNAVLEDLADELAIYEAKK